MVNPHFQIGQNIGNYQAKYQTQNQDNSAIESILSQAMQTEDPAVLQNSIGKILSNVSPERQGAAVQFLQNTMQNLQSKKEKEKAEREGREAADKVGYTYGAPATVQAQQVKDKAKAERMDISGNVQGKTGFSQLTEDQLIKLSGHPDREISEPAKAQLKNIQKIKQEDRADVRQAKAETAPLKKEIIDKANLSRASIKNKTQLLDLIDKGDINDPTFAAIASIIPFNLGKRLLSPDTVQYKGALVDEFGDLKNIFKGATRVKEVEIYEDKLADIYLTDEQKKAIIKSRMNMARIDILREESAQEVEDENPNVSALKFNQLVEKKLQPKLDAIFNEVWEKQKNIIDQAENRKQIPLNINDPDDKIIIGEIVKEAKEKGIRPQKIAKDKGYTW
jgi:hypothetical protein